MDLLQRAVFGGADVRAADPGGGFGCVGAVVDAGDEDVAPAG